MSREKKHIADNPKDAMRLYIEELEKDYYPWYERSSHRLKWAWGLGQATSLVAGVLASVLAAAAPREVLIGFGPVRIALVVLPILGALASSLLVQTRARDLLALREQGREAIQTLLSHARAEYAASAEDSHRLKVLHEHLVEKISKLEREQAFDFLSIAPGGTPSADTTKNVP